ncbi:hypothetical protein AAVH_22788 [Aphelenchoides avenae]|nr:hypothetical protein AAVH_22788 [Aphelenchus avenae]
MVDGTEWDNCCGYYTNWAPGEDNSSFEKCAAMRDDGMWADVLCDFDDHGHHFLMCEKPASVTPTTTEANNHAYDDRGYNYRYIDRAYNNAYDDRGYNHAHDD